MITVLGSEVRVNTYTDNTQARSSATSLIDGGWVVTWSSEGQDSSFCSIYQQVYNADGTARGSETKVNTYSDNTQDRSSATSLIDGGWVVSWSSYGQDTSFYGIYQQVYNADGTERGSERQVNTYTSNSQYLSNITSLINGGWVVAWSSNGQDGSDYGIYQQVYNADGTARGSETKVNTYTYNTQALSSATSLIDGGWVVSWSSYGQDTSKWGIYQQVYNADGTERGSETQVNTYTNDSQDLSSITSLIDGGWVVSWSSIGQDGSDYGIYQQVYNANGTERGSETQVNTYANDTQVLSSPTPLIDGGWVVSWSSLGQDGSVYGIYQQIYNADGTERGPEIQVNKYTTGFQSNSSTDSLADGGWVVTWSSDGQDGSSYGVYQRVVHEYDVTKYEAGGGSQTVYAGSGNETIYGDTRSKNASAPTGDDELYGLAGKDKLLGGGGADKLIGGSGADQLTGGLGADQFIFDDGDSGISKGTIDRIADFSSLEGDRIDLSLVDGDLASVGDDTLTIAATQTDALASVGHIWIEGRGKHFVVYINNDAAAGFEMAIEVRATGGVTAGDFLL